MTASAAGLGAVEARKQLDSGELAAVTLVEDCLTQIERINPAVNAVVTLAQDRALSEAAVVDAAIANGTSNGRLAGLPVLVKDLVPTEGIRTTYGSPDFADHVPADDAGMVARIRAAGGIVLGKTNIPEQSIGANTRNPLFGATGNPFDPDLTCGGSSGGSAVALATSMAPLATGSDHGGSVRIPACYCGIVGHRATPGVVPHELRSVTQTFYSVQGPMARSVEDVALMLSVIAGRDHGGSNDPMAFPLDAGGLGVLDDVDPSKLRIAVSEDLGGVLVSESIRSTFRDRVERIAGIAAVVEPHPIDLRLAPGVDWRVRSDLFVAQWGEQAASWDHDFNPNIRQSYEAALETPMDDIAAARRIQMSLYQSFCAIFEEFDVLICPGVSVPPFPWIQRNPTEIDGAPVENYMAWLALSSSLTVVGHPVTALPCGLDAAGTPFGVQVVGPAYQDRRLLSIARALELAFSADQTMHRPVPDLDALADMTTRCGDPGALQ